MNFDFSQESQLVRAQAQKLLAASGCPGRTRRALEAQDSDDRDLWRAVAEAGWLGANIPEEFGGTGPSYETLCVLAEELGRVVAPLPFSSSVYLATEALLAAGTASQKRRILPALAVGDRIATLALSEGPGNPRPDAIAARHVGGRLSGSKWPVPDGGIADLAIVAARNAADEIGLYLVDLGAAGVARRPLRSVDPSRALVALDFEDADAEPLMKLPGGWAAVERLLDRAAILAAFEQIGGAASCLDMAKGYAMQRFAFGRPIGSFQAIKHKLADVYIALELARSNAYYGAWALEADAPDLPLAAAAARLAATDAFVKAATENIQVHGGIGFTWESDCHLYYRRSKLLALTLGSPSYWKERIVAGLERRQAAS
jgi:alkylation response protein AidB-like acyl-CoA dehydrogenase